MACSVHVCATAQHRGAERFAVDLVGAMVRHGADARALALWPGGPAPLLDVPVLGTRPYGLSTLWRLRSTVGRGAVAVAHGSSSLGAGAVALAGRAPFAYRSIGDPAFWASSPARRRRTRVLLERAHTVVVMWPEAAESFRSLYGGAIRRLVVIPKGISTNVASVTAAERAGARDRLGISDERAVVAYLGALSPEKDPAAAVHAVAAIGGAHLVVIGGGPLSVEVAGLAQHRLPGRHTIVGPLADPRAALAAADALVLPSRSEGVPSAPLEAGLLGIPSVVTRVGGAPTTVADRTSAQWCRPAIPAPSRSRSKPCSPSPPLWACTLVPMSERTSTSTSARRRGGSCVTRWRSTGGHGPTGNLDQPWWPPKPNRAR